jgi:hypothetical protein
MDIYIAGTTHVNYKEYKSDIQADDTLILTIDYDQERISLTNERTHRVYDLDIDMTKYLFPRQSNVRFFINSN